MYNYMCIFGGKVLIDNSRESVDKRSFIYFISFKSRELLGISFPASASKPITFLNQGM